jgi:hypothetical protein
VPLPSGTLTFHADASVATDLWTVNTAGVFSVQSTDTGVVNYWDDVEHGANDAQYGGGGAPTWQSTNRLLPLPCLKFTANPLQIRTDAANVDVASSSLITASAFTFLVAIYIESSTTNNANAIDNDGVLANRGSYFGISIKNPGTGILAQFFNYDTNYRTIELGVTLNTPYVLMFRHDSGNLYASLNGGAETSLACGNTAVLTDALSIGSDYTTNHIFQGRIGEVAIYNAALSGTNLSDAIAYFRDRWLLSTPGRPFQTLWAPLLAQ